MKENTTESFVLEGKNKDNRKPNAMRRIAGGIIDICIIFLLYWGLYTLFMNTPVASKFDEYSKECQIIQDLTSLETGYGTKVEITEENRDTYSSLIHYSDYNSISNQNYTYVVLVKDNYTNEEKEAYQTSLSNSTRYQNYSFNMQLINYGINVLSGSISLAITILIIPLLNKKRGSIGDLASGQIVFSKKYENYARWYNILIRYIFIVLIDGCLPFLFIELWTFIAIPFIIFIISLLTESGRSLHDLVSGIKKIDATSFKPLVEH